MGRGVIMKNNVASPKKKYAGIEYYERKLNTVMDRLGVGKYNFNWDRHGGWVDFYLKNECYRFEHSIAKAETRGFTLKYGSDAFAQIVLSLEDLARMVERGIYELSTWVAGMRFLPPPAVVPDFFLVMGFQEIPAGPGDVTERYRTLAKTMHPDVSGGSAEKFKQLQSAAESAKRYFDKEGAQNGN
jgi:hypothetical protein